MADYVSQYTGAKIDQAIGAYFSGDTRSTIVEKLNALALLILGICPNVF